MVVLRYVWVRIPEELQCDGGRIRWWQPDPVGRNLMDWALDSVIIGGFENPPDNVTFAANKDLTPPLWLRMYNTEPGKSIFIPVNKYRILVK